MSTAPKVAFEHELPEMTSPDEALIGNDVTGNHVTGTGSHMNGSDRVRMHNGFPRFCLL